MYTCCCVIDWAWHVWWAHRVCVCVCVTAAALGGVPVSVYVCQISGQHFAVTADPTSKRK